MRGEVSLARASHIRQRLVPEAGRGRGMWRPPLDLQPLFADEDTQVERVWLIHDPTVRWRNSGLLPRSPTVLSLVGPVSGAGTRDQSCHTSPRAKTFLAAGIPQGRKKKNAPVLF